MLYREILAKFPDFAVLLARPNSVMAFNSSKYMTLVQIVDCVTNGHLRVKLLAYASKVVRIVSLDKHFWTKLKNLGGRRCCLILQEDRTR